MTKPVLEDQFLAQVIGLARFYGWLSAHFRPARMADGRWRTPVQGNGKGFPDLVLVRGPEIVFAELKSDRGRLRQEQHQWLAALEKVAREFGAWLPGEDGTVGAAFDVFVWTPADFDEMHARLARGRQRHEPITRAA